MAVPTDMQTLAISAEMTSRVVGDTDRRVIADLGLEKISPAAAKLKIVAFKALGWLFFSLFLLKNAHNFVTYYFNLCSYT